MSKANRKRTFDNLVAAGRVKDISKALMEEFGKPVPAPVPVVATCAMVGKGKK